MKITLSFGRYIDEKNSKYGKDISPGVEFQDVPEDAESLVLTMDDPDSTGTPFTHWLIWNIPPDQNLEEGLPREKKLDFGAKQGNNDYGEIGYGGPRPPVGERHEYRFEAYALDTKLELERPVSKPQIKIKIEGHVLDKSKVTAPYKRDFDKSQKAM